MHPLTSPVALWTLAALASLVTPCLPLAADEGAARVPEPSADNVRIPNAVHASGVRRALIHASRTLAKPKCRRIFQEFSDSAGRSLQEALDTQGTSSEAHLASLLFYDGSAHPRCKVKYTFAVTVPRSRVILVCAPQFSELALRKPRIAASVLRHEQLHALGLGENPPTSAEITERVMMRCAP